MTTEIIGFVTLTILISAYLFGVSSTHMVTDKQIGRATNNNTVLIGNILENEREKIVEEMRSMECENGFDNLDDLKLESKGTPFRSVIVTTWRSGSTFLGDILNSLPGNYHHFEPLMDYGINIVRGPPQEEQAIYQVKQLLNCNYSNLNDYVSFGAKHKFLHNYNTRLWRHCYLHPDHPNRTEVQSTAADDPRYCSNANFLSAFCKLFPLQSMKILRLRLAMADQLLEDPSLNVRIVFMVRDPRAVLLSRKHCKWCGGNPDCDHLPTVCNDMVVDYYSAKNLQTKYPHRFKVVRYEELSLDPFPVTEEILKFYGLPFNQIVVDFLESHTKQDIGNIFSTFRDSSTTPFRWIRNLTYTEITDTQMTCSEALNLWGYQRMEESDFNHSAEFNPLLQWTFQ